MIQTAIYYDRFINLTLNYIDVNAFEGSTQQEKEARAAAWDKMTESQMKSSSRMQYTKKVEIICPRSGMKPSISFNWHRLDDNTCYLCTLKVHNLKLPVNAIWVDSIKVEAGYNSNNGVHKNIFSCIVFDAYTPAPGPDSETIFECIVASADSNMFSDQPYIFWLYNGGSREPWEKSKTLLKKTDDGFWTVQAVIAESCEKMGLRGFLFMPDEIKNAKFSSESIPPKDLTSGYATIGFLQNKLNAIGASAKNEEDRFYVTTTVFNDTVYFIACYKNNTVYLTKTPEAEKAVKIYELDLVSSVDWNAGILTVRAPWTPEIKPATLFKIRPSYYNGSKALPNSVAREGAQKDTFDLYYVILQTVNFATVDDTNEMELTAVPFKYSPLNNQSLEETKVSTDTLFTQYKDLSKQDVIPITFGAEDEKLQEEVKKAVSVTELTLDFLPSEVTHYIIQPGDNLSQLCQKSEFKLPDLEGELDGQHKKVFAYNAWYPIMLLLTYTQYKRTPNSKPSFEISPSKPDFIQANHYLLIPTISWKEVQMKYKSQVVKALNTCYEYYMSQNVSKPSWAGTLSLAAQLIERGVLQ